MLRKKKKTLVFFIFIVGVFLFVSDIISLKKEAPNSGFLDFGLGETVPRGFSKVLNLNDLKNWAAVNQYEVFPDSDSGGFRNNVCAFIKKDGAELTLYSSSFEEQIIYFDFVRFRAKDIDKNSAGYQHLTIYINGQKLKELEFGFSKVLSRSIKIVLDPVFFPERKIHIQLIPAPGPKPLWALWDIHLKALKDVRGDRK